MYRSETELRLFFTALFFVYFMANLDGNIAFRAASICVEHDEHIDEILT